MNTPEIYYLTDDGKIPNNPMPVLLYRQVFVSGGEGGADWLEARFAENNWKNSFRWHVYDYHHYHTNTHEVLGVYAGKALLQIGGKQGKELEVLPGDVLILPAGTGHASLSRSVDFSVVGAYPDGKEPDMIKLQDPRPDDVRRKIARVPLPEADPLYGQVDGLIEYWIDNQKG